MGPDFGQRSINRTVELIETGLYKQFIETSFHKQIFKIVGMFSQFTEWMLERGSVKKPTRFLNGPTRPLFHLFSSFQRNFTTNRYVKKCSSSIRCRDSNSRSLEHESPPITIRSRLPHQETHTFYGNIYLRVKDHVYISPIYPYSGLRMIYRNKILYTH